MHDPAIDAVLKTDAAHIAMFQTKAQELEHQIGALRGVLILIEALMEDSIVLLRGLADPDIAVDRLIITRCLDNITMALALAEKKSL